MSFRDRYTANFGGYGDYHFSSDSGYYYPGYPGYEEISPSFREDRVVGEFDSRFPSSYYSRERPVDELRGRLPEDNRYLVVNDLQEPYTGSSRYPLSNERKEILDKHERLPRRRSRSPIIKRNFDKDDLKTGYTKSSKRKSRSRSLDRDAKTRDRKRSFERPVSPIHRSERERSTEKLSLSAIERQIEYEKKRQQMLIEQQKSHEKRSERSIERLLSVSKKSYELNKESIPPSRSSDRKEDLRNRSNRPERSTTPVGQARRFKGDNIIIERGRSYERRSKSPVKRYRSRERSKELINDRYRSLNKSVIESRRSRSPSKRYRSREGSKELAGDRDRPSNKNLGVHRTSRERRSLSPGKRYGSRERSKEFFSDRHKSPNVHKTSNVSNREKTESLENRKLHKNLDEPLGKIELSSDTKNTKNMQLHNIDNSIQTVTTTTSSDQEKLCQTADGNIASSDPNSALFILDPFDNRTDNDFGDVVSTKEDSSVKNKKENTVNCDGQESTAEEQRFNAYDLLFGEQKQYEEKPGQSTRDIASDNSKSISENKQFTQVSYQQADTSVPVTSSYENPELKIIQNSAASDQQHFKRPDQNLQYINQQVGQFCEDPALVEAVLKAASIVTSIGDIHLNPSSSQISVQPTKQPKEPQCVDLTKYLAGTFGADYLAYLDNNTNDEVEIGDDDTEEQTNPLQNIANLSPAVLLRFRNDPPSTEELGYMLKGFVIFFDVRSDSQLEKNPFIVIQDSFSKSGFGNLEIEEFEIFMNGPTQVCLLRWRGVMLARGRGRSQNHAREEAALALINTLAKFCYTIQCKYSYYCGGALPKYMIENPECPEIYKLIPREEFIKAVTKTLRTLKERGFSYRGRGIDAANVYHVIYFIEEFFKRKTHVELFFGGMDPMEFTLNEIRQISSHVTACPWLQWRRLGGKGRGNYLSISRIFTPQQLYRYLVKHNGDTLRYRLIPPQGPFIDLLLPDCHYNPKIIRYSSETSSSQPGTTQSSGYQPGPTQTSGYQPGPTQTSGYQPGTTQGIPPIVDERSRYPQPDRGRDRRNYEYWAA